MRKRRTAIRAIQPAVLRISSIKCYRPSVALAVYCGGMIDRNQSPNWVKIRAECAFLPIFKKLEMDVREDVNTRNQLSNASLPLIDVQENEAKTLFLVFGREPRNTVEFALYSDHITVKTPRNTFTITLTLDDDCRCRLRVSEPGMPERVLDQWQLRKLALEDLFFGPTSSPALS